MFPGDTEFSWRNFSDLPYPYVVDAVTKSLKVHQRRLHEYEVPIALQTSVIANQSRDQKKRKQPYGYEDFSMYKPREDLDLPDGHYGSAMIEAVKARLLPAWALFCYKELASTANRDYAPPNPILVSEDAVLLHPVRVAGGFEGLLIARESASDRLRVFKDKNGTEYKLNVPHVNTKIIAVEDCVLKM